MEKSKLIAEFPKNGQPSWIHVSYNSCNNRNKIMIATKINNKTTYLMYKGNEHLLG